MSLQSNINDNPSWKRWIKFLLILTSVLLVSLAFPKYLFEDLKVNQPWNKSDVIANNDIQLSMNDIDKSNRLDAYSKSLGTIYAYESVNTEKLSRDFVGLTNADSNMIAVVKSVLDNCYLTGVYQAITGFKKVSVYKNESVKTFQKAELCSRDELFDQLRDVFSDYGYVLNARSRRSILDALNPNLIANQDIKNQLISAKQDELSKGGYTFQKGDTIIKKGDILTQSQYEILRKNSSRFSLVASGINWVSFLGYFLLITIIILVMVLYVRKYFNEVYRSNRQLSFLLIWPVIFSFLIYGIENFTSLSTYVIPFCIVPIIAKNFFEDRLALFLHIVVVLIASILSRMGYEFTFVQILAGMVTVLIVSQTRYWDRFFLAIGFILLSYVLSITGLNLATWDSAASFEWQTFAWLVVNALLLLLAYPFIPLLENIFGFTSSIKLAELADMNKPLLKELSLKAPGTLQHSLQVANLCEAAAEEIGANSLLVKTAALYHDIGKTLQPQYFIENSTGESPHIELNNNFESAKIIIGHVTEGVELAKKNRLPKVVIDFIRSHHGTTRVEYFYRNQLKQHPDKEFDESIFRYPGPLPITKEQTIMMIADSVEAASKSLKNPSGQDIDQLIDKIVAHKIDEGQLDNSRLSFQELLACVNVFKNMLRSIHHVRIEYPEDPHNKPSLNEG